MAAKLKKRAAAEYQSQTIALDEGETSSSSQLLSEEPRKRLKLVLQRSTGSTSSRTADQDVLPIDKITNSREISGLLVQLLPKIKSMEREEVVEAATKIIAATGRDLEDSVKVQLFLALGFILSSSDPVSAEVRPLVRDHVEEWLQSLAKEKANKTISAVLGLIAKLHEYHIPLNCKSYTKVFEVIQEHLKSNDISVRINALRVIGGCLVHSGVARMNTKILSICGKFTHSPEPRIRSTAFESLLSIHKNGHRLNIGMYSSVCQALDDDYDGARQAALRLVHILGQTYPDERVKVNPLFLCPILSLCNSYSSGSFR